MDSYSLNIDELTTVMDTLTKRRAWILQAIEDGDIDPESYDDHVLTEQLLQSAMKKLHAQKKRALITTMSDTKLSVVPRKHNTNFRIEELRILVVEDDSVSAQILVAVINNIGIPNVDVAMNGDDAFYKIRTSKLGYDIIFCDWAMPGVSGVELYQKVTLSNMLKDAYFCMVTSMAETKMIREAIKVGVNDYIVKPVDAEILELKIRNIMNRKNAG